MVKTDLPYSTEYAKSNRSSCKGCKNLIAQGTLRMAVMVQSPMFDGKTPNWYHVDCFFKKQRPKSIDDIHNFESLRLEDQDRLKPRIGLSNLTIVPDKKGTKRKNDPNTKLKKEALKDFTIEYAKSGRALCRGCEQKILKDEVRISKKDFETDVGKKYGGQDMWHHVACFAQIRSDLGYFESGDKLPGFKNLNKSDQENVKKTIVPIKQEDIPEVKKLKTDEVDGDLEEKKYRDQVKKLFKCRDNLEKLTPNERKDLLEYNDQGIQIGKDIILDQLADAMTFGALLPCPTCRGQFVFTVGGYECKGDISEWTKCKNFVKEPERKPFKIPPNFKSYDFLKKYKCTPTTRIIKQKSAPNKLNDVKKEDTVDGPRVKRELPALYNMHFVIVGYKSNDKSELKKKIELMGGKVVTKISTEVMAVIARDEDIEKRSSRIQEAESQDIHVVSKDFLDEASSNVGKIPDLIIKKSICNWGSDPTTRLPSEPSTSHKSKSGSIYTKSIPSKVKLKLKGGLAVDPDSGLEHRAHVYQDGDDKYTTVLGLTDIQSGRNSYYKMQVLESDNKHSYWFFRSWGRIGTTIGGNKTESMESLHEAISQFKIHYEEKSGNMWEQRQYFQKVPGKMYPIDVDYGDDQKVNLEIVKSDSNLPQPVQDLMKMIFDVKMMEKLMLEYELDMEKMPLGKLSQKQIQKAYSVLNELQTLINDNNTETIKYIDATNRFYTFIPHSFGIDDPPILNTAEVISQKLDMLDSLNQLAEAYSLMTAGTDHTVDGYYSQLNTEIGVLDQKSEEFAIISEYVQNTHAATHDQYELIIDEIFTVKRHGEDKRFKPFRKLHNRKLLWHGSRVTNYPGILSQGLRIAPPEAPVTGYMFGKGIYFADMVSKSANYCCTNPNKPKGLMMLCDVALGNTYDRFNAENIQKLPKGKHSCRGVGRTHPDPSYVKKIEDIEVPLGKGVNNPEAKNATLLYNEYIVYDVAQVNIRYLLKMHFKYKFN